MQTVAGVFTSREAARNAIDRLGTFMAPDRITALFPGASKEEIDAVPKSEDMPPAGRAMVATLGGAIGLGLGVTLFLPAVGAITVVGLLASIVMGVAGAAAGGSVGHAADEAGTYGLPVDELSVYADALKQGRSVVIVLTEGDEMTASVRRHLTEAGAETINAARENWWIGLRSAEEAEYGPQTDVAAEARTAFRRGFRSGLEPSGLDGSYEDEVDALRRRYPDDYALPEFKKGFERGRQYWRHEHVRT